MKTNLRLRWMAGAAMAVILGGGAAWGGGPGGGRGGGHGRHGGRGNPIEELTGIDL